MRRRAWHVEIELVGNDDTVDRNELAHADVDDRLRRTLELPWNSRQKKLSVVALLAVLVRIGEGHRVELVADGPVVPRPNQVLVPDLEWDVLAPGVPYQPDLPDEEFPAKHGQCFRRDSRNRFSKSKRHEKNCEIINKKMRNKQNKNGTINGQIS